MIQNWPFSGDHIHKKGSVELVVVYVHRYACKHGNQDICCFQGMEAVKVGNKKATKRGRGEVNIVQRCSCSV